MQDVAKLTNNILSDITVYMKYARYIPEIQRRETWEELVERNMVMHIGSILKSRKRLNRSTKTMCSTRKCYQYAEFAVCGGRALRLTQAEYSIVHL